jgi:hypothetical protein
LAGSLCKESHDQRAYLAFSNAVVRAMRQLGLKSATERAPSLAEYLRAKAEGAAA